VATTFVSATNSRCKRFFSTVQYSFSNDGQNMVETLVLRVRDAKDLMQVSLEDSASSVTSPADMLAVDNPVNRIRLERFGTSSVALARCTASEGGAPQTNPLTSRCFVALPRC